MPRVATWNDVDDAVKVIEVTYTETAGAGVYTGTAVIPAGSTLIDIQVHGIAVWTNTGTVSMDVGDGDDLDAWYAGINMKATDLLAGEVIRFSSSGGKEGDYLVQASGLLSAAYGAAERTISGVITTSSTGGTAGRTRMLVIYACPVSASTAATKV